MQIPEGLNVTVSIQNLDQLKAAIAKAEKATKELKEAIWELSNLKIETKLDVE